ncbi:MAG: glutaredoxin family protein [Gammaproteobacteria bacterium]|nr:glutaredoxin family protein [Gammaproteobacteria bacterium]
MKRLQLYVSPGCPDCAALKSWLTARAILWEEHDLSQPGVADDAKRRLGVRVAPITVIGEHVLYGTFAEQLPRLKALLTTKD